MRGKGSAYAMSYYYCLFLAQATAPRPQMEEMDTLFLTPQQTFLIPIPGSPKPMFDQPLFHRLCIEQQNVPLFLTQIPEAQQGFHIDEFLSERHIFAQPLLISWVTWSNDFPVELGVLSMRPWSKSIFTCEASPILRITLLDLILGK